MKELFAPYVIELIKQGRQMGLSKLLPLSDLTMGPLLDEIEGSTQIGAFAHSLTDAYKGED